jgi:hypothetical protein
MKTMRSRMTFYRITWQELDDIVLAGHSYAGILITVRLIASPPRSARWTILTQSCLTTISRSTTCPDSRGAGSMERRLYD